MIVHSSLTCSVFAFLDPYLEFLPVNWHVGLSVGTVTSKKSNNSSENISVKMEEKYQDIKILHLIFHIFDLFCLKKITKNV
jgi:hypothetical protein